MEPPHTEHFLISDHLPAYRQGIINFLQSSFPGCAVDEASSEKEIFSTPTTRLYTTILIEIEPPKKNWQPAIEQLRVTYPYTPVIAMSDWEDEDFIIEVLRSGVNGFLPKTAGCQDCKHAIETLAMQNLYIDEKKYRGLLKKLLSPGEQLIKTELSKREQEIMYLVCDDKTSKQIASSLYISIKTVETHRDHILKKTNTHNAVELMNFARKKRWI